MYKSSSSLQKYIDYLGLPMGIFPAIDQIYRAMDGRIWLIDNSSHMGEMDSHLIRADPDFGRIEKVDGVCRWAELSQCIDFHTTMASRCWIPTQFRLLNESAGVPRKFTVCWGLPDEVASEREYVSQCLKHVRLESKINPLARHIRKLTKYFSRDADILRKRNEFVAVTICTHGIPTDENGRYDRYVLKEFVDSLADLAAMPVRIVFRLTTDDDKVLEFFGSLDMKYDCDVLDDFWGEAMEIYLHNPWLTYGIGIHRLREAGLGTDIMDNLDEKPFSLEEIRAFCIEFFIGKNVLSLRNPKVDLNGFFEDLQMIVEREKLVWNPVKNKLCPWIDVDKLKLMIRRDTAGSTRAIQKPHFRRSVTMDPPDAAYRHVQNRRENRPLAASARVSAHGAPQASNGGSKAYFYRKSSLDSSFSEIPADKRANFPRSSSFTETSGQKTMPQVNSKGTAGAAPKDLQETIQQWSRVAPNYKKLKPLEVLLVDVPKLFPPTNRFCESHEHFLKWKAFSEDAFIGESGDELKELLRRASRKSKLFMHPDKLPKELTPSQDTLLKSMWEIIQESEAATL